MHSPVLKLNKLRPPPLAATIIARPDLLQPLHEAAKRNCVLSLLSAPVGYGKSTLLAQFAASLTTPWAWLRLDGDDNRPLNLLVHLHRTLGLPPQHLSPEPLCEAKLWAAIIESLEQRRGVFTLLLDDLQWLRAPSACRYLDELLHHAPPSLHIVAATEGVPALALSHLHRRRGLQLLDAHHLALDSSEVDALATARGLAPGSDLVYQLCAKSEGWLSGILLGLAAEEELRQPSVGHARSGTSTVQGMQSLVMQFFEEEVLRHQPLQLRRFLESLTVVSTFDTELAAYLSGHQDASAMLRRLLRQDLFIQRHDEQNSQFRLHPQLRQALYERLRQRSWESLKQLHQRAAEWLLQRQCYADAIHQLGRARDFNALLSVIDRHSFDLLREGKVNAIVEVLSDVPGQDIDDHFTFVITEASTVIVTNDIERATSCQLRLHRLLRDQAVPERRAERGHQTLAFLRSRLAFLGGNFQHGVELVDKALKHYPQANAATAVLLFNRASCLLALGKLRSAHDDTERALHELNALDFSGYINLLHLQLGLIELAQGAIAQASERFANLPQHSQSAAQRNFYDLFQHLGKGVVWLQQNQLQPATQQLAQAEVIALGFPHCAGLPWVLHYQALCLAAQGDLSKAGIRWDEARRLAHRFKLFALYRQIGAWRVRLAVRELDESYIADWLQEWQWCSHRYGQQLPPEEWLAYAWVQRHLGRHAMAAKITLELHALAATEDNHQLRIDLYLLDATLALDSANRLLALRNLESALQLAYRQNLGQLPRLVGHELGELLRQLISPQVRRQYGLELPLPPHEQLAGLMQGLSTHFASNETLPEPLTRRELDVLRRIAAGQSNQQIADGLYVSPSTVKTHINNLFRKLDAVDREGALQIARALNLLS